MQSGQFSYFVCSFILWMLAEVCFLFFYWIGEIILKSWSFFCFYFCRCAGCFEDCFTTKKQWCDNLCYFFVLFFRWSCFVVVICGCLLWTVFIFVSRRNWKNERFELWFVLNDMNSSTWNNKLDRWLNSNQFSGPLPSEIGKLVNLESLYILSFFSW